jgi:hypothetical protein
VNLCTQYAELAGFDFDILPTVQDGLFYFHRFRENISELSLIVAYALIRAFGAMRLRDKIKFPITICRTQNSSGTPKFMRTANRQSEALRAIILSSGIFPKSETNGGDDMADIAKKISKLDEKIGKLKERIQSDTAECEKLSEQKALLIYQSLCKQYSCEGQALADMIAREHEQAAMPVADEKSVSDNSSADDADEEEMLDQTSFFEKKNPYSD